MADFGIFPVTEDLASVAAMQYLKAYIRITHLERPQGRVYHKDIISVSGTNKQ